MKKFKSKSNDLGAWSDGDLQAVNLNDEYEAVAEVLDRRGYGYSSSSAALAQQDSLSDDYARGGYAGYAYGGNYD